MEVKTPPSTSLTREWRKYKMLASTERRLHGDIQTMSDSNATIEIIEPGLLTTVQDLGRRGFQRYGIPVCGALDSVSLRIANILVGNPEGAAGLEVTFMGPALRFTADAVFAVVGADFALEVDGRPARTWESVKASAGATLRLGQATDGLRAYIAVAGGIEVPSLMGSRSTDLKGGFGGFEGRALQAGDALPVGHSLHVAGWTPASLPSGISRQPTYGQDFTIRATLGPQDGEFTDAGLNTLLSSEYTVSTQSDRMGYRLDGPAVEHQSGADIVSDGSAFGSVQIPGNGQPIILLADRGTTGGYTKVATVIGPDIGLLAQAMPGARVRFAAVTVEEARDALREQEDLVREIKSSVGIDLSGAISVTSDGNEALALDADGKAITATGLRPSKTSTRTATVTIDGQRFEFPLGVGTA